VIFFCENFKTGERELEKMTGRILNRQLGLLVGMSMMATVCLSVTFAQESSGEAEIAAARECTARSQYDSSLAHYNVGKSIFATSSRRDLYYKCLAGIADNLISKSRFVTADSLLTGILVGALSELGEYHAVTGEVYYLLAFLRTYQDRPDQAKNFYLHALAIWSRVYGENHWVVAGAYYGIGTMYQRRGELDTAFQYLSTSKRILEGTKDSGSVVLANTLAAIGNVYELRSEYSKAIDELSKASSILAGAGLSASASSVYCNHFLAICYKDIGQIEIAVSFQKKSLEIARKIYGERHLNVAAGVAQLGDYLAAGGDFEIAVECYREAISIFTELIGKNHSSVNEVERKMAGLYAQRGDYDRALEIDIRVASSHARDFGPNNPELGFLYHEVAEIYRKKGKFEKAFGFYARALALRNEIHGSTERLDIAGLLHDEAQAYAATGKYDTASSLLRQSLRLQDSATSVNPALRSSTYESLAAIARGEGDISGSVRWYQQALFALCPEFRDTSFSANPEVPGSASCRDYVRLLSGKAAALLDRRWNNHSSITNLRAALGAYTRASDALTRLRVSYRAEDSKLTLQEEGSSMYSAAMSVAVHLAQKTGDPGAKETAFGFSERGKASVLLEALESAKVRHFAGIPEQLLEEEQRLRGELAGLLNRAEWTQRRTDSASSSALRSAILDRNWRIDKLEDSLANCNPQFRNMLSAGRLASTSDVQRALEPGTCLIAYTMGPGELNTFVVQSSSCEIVTRAKPGNLDSLARRLRHGLKTLDDQEYLPAARELYVDLIQPIEKHLKGVSRLVIIPDGSLYYLPFEVFLSSDVQQALDDRGRMDFRRLPYLVNRFEICYALSGTLYSETQTSRENMVSFAGFAPVTRASYASTALSRANRFSTLDFAGGHPATTPGYAYSALPFSANEVRKIARAFTASGRLGTYTVGSDATKKDFAAHAQDHSIVHIATHGFIDEDHPERSALLFAPGPDTASGGDPLLYAGEIYNLRLNADLVTLSSCESGVGKLVKGEGLMAMTRGFFYAGAKNVVCSLWKVYDEQTNQLMRGFYRHVLEGKSYSTALREAKLEMIRNAATAHPFKWAAFELIGG
jgi:CHAT domain-containing protein